jgi:hypothetical protein
VLKLIPASTLITKPTVVTASQSNGSATTRITPAVSSKTATFVFQEQAVINGFIHYTWNYAGTATKTANQPHSWLLKVPANSAGNTLIVAVEPLSTYQVGTAQIDIGNDTSLEIDHKTTAGKLTRTFNLGTGAVDVRIATLMDLVAQYGKIDSDFRVALTLNPDTPVKVSSYGSMCGMKTTMSGTITAAGHRLTARIEGAFPKHGTMLLRASRFPAHPARCSSFRSSRPSCPTTPTARSTSSWTCPGGLTASSTCRRSPRTRRSATPASGCRTESRSTRTELAVAVDTRFFNASPGSSTRHQVLQRVGARSGR